MEFDTVTIRASKQLTLFCHRGLFLPVQTFNFVAVLSFTFFWTAACGTCSMNGMQKPAAFDVCRSFGEVYDLGFAATIAGDPSSGYGTPSTHHNLGSGCTDSHSFCFPSTLSGFMSKEKKLKAAALEDSGIRYHSSLPLQSTPDSKCANNKSWSSDYGMFKLFNGRAVSCSLSSMEGNSDLSSLQTDGGNKNDLSSCRVSLPKKETTHLLPKNSEMIGSCSIDDSSSPDVKISPTVLDWGQKYLYFPSVAFLTVANTCNDSILHVYEPFSTNLQFYPCNFTEVSLGPGEVASICFVFLPRWLGLSSGHLILQTSSGGFLVQAEGYATESPFGIQPLIGLQVSPGGKLSKNLSLFNAFDETLYVEEVTAWISVSLEHNNYSHQTEAICSINNYQVSGDNFFPTVKDRLVVKTGQTGSPVIAMRPHRNWEIGPHSSETIIEVDFSVGFEGKVFGAFCLQLLRSSQDKPDTIMVPLEAEVGGSDACEVLAGFVSASLEGVGAHDGNKTIVSISLRNDAPYLLRFLKVIEVAETEVFHIKYMEGLLLYPSTITQVAVITCTHVHAESTDSSPEVTNVYKNCKFLILTNDSSSPQIEIPCLDITYICSRYQKLSSFGYEHKYEDVKSGNTRAGNSMQLPSQVKVLGMAEVDDLVLGNWKSQGNTDGMSVIDDHELQFSMIQVGSRASKWISVRNPSEHPVIMQLILNSGEIIDECRVPDGLVHPLSSGSLLLDESPTPSTYGFSLTEIAQTEAYVHPYGRVFLGPIFFSPSKQCGWRSSALIRNNLSGVEWFSLTGFGGSLSLVLLEGSEPIQSVEFQLNVPSALNFSLPYALVYMNEMTSACSQPLLKELFAKNTGDLPLEVKRIAVSGTDCGLDGFMVHSCRGFALDPGEAIKLLISYQTDFSESTVHRDLELALATGILVIPMKASFPPYMLSNCKKSVFWMRVKKFFVAFLLVASLMCLVICCIFPQTLASGTLECLWYSEKSLIYTTIRTAGNTPCVHHNQRNGKLSMSSGMDCLLCSSGDNRTSMMQPSSGGYCYGRGRVCEPRMSCHVNQTLENPRQTNDLLDTPNERMLTSATIESLDALEASQLSNLTVNTGKGKGKRRRKRKGPGAKLTGLFEVSSSQSGNSTPSSPLSPITSVIPKRNWPMFPDAEQSIESRNPFTQLADQHCEKDKASVFTSETNMFDSGVPVKYRSNNLFSPSQGMDSVPRKTNKTFLRPSATFPSAGRPVPNVLSSSPILVSTSTIAPHARAPGSKLNNEKSVNAEEKVKVQDEYTYDIWGDHFSGLHLVGPSKNVASMISRPADNNSDIFFVRGPQALMTNSQLRSVSRLHQEGQ
ncbi:Transmembrane protein [Quillaja saponaria]|uniref:Transmembrane protein n=1 Tax=Quillaja saponaria TaxID=32244 RepID=A0AAD7KRQ0_QUISA|nr:Transmembrane protein [Quillaja saponaria]